jgi:hypothetical protein
MFIIKWVNLYLSSTVIYFHIRIVGKMNDRGSGVVFDVANSFITDGEAEGGLSCQDT